MLKRLSYDMTAESPGWPGNFKVEVEPYAEIAQGDGANLFTVKFLNHFGSHMDGPRHFNNNGPRLAEMPLETFFYDAPLLVDIPKGELEEVHEEDLRPFHDQIASADLLMIRSGFAQERERNPDLYAGRGPCVHSDACKYLMDHFPNLKAIAMDWVSLATPTKMDDGVLAHQYLLGMFHDHYICIIEDINFREIDPSCLEKAWSVPLFVERTDSSPVTVFASLRDE